MSYPYLPAAVLFAGDTPLVWQPLGVNDPWDPEDISEELLGGALTGDAATAELDSFAVRFGRAPRPDGATTDGAGAPEGWELLDAPEMRRLGEVTTEALRRKLAKVRARAG